MADTINISQLIDKLKRSGVDDRLIQKIVGAAAQTRGSMGLDSTATVAEIRTRVEEVQRLLNENKGFLDGVIDVEDEVARIEEEEMDLLKEIIDEEIKSTEMNRERVENAKKRYKQLLKNKKQREVFNEGMAKGDAMADQLLQATLGINRSFSFLNEKGGMGGLLKGFTGGIMKSLGPMNIIVSLITKMFERIQAFDAAEADMFRKAAIDRGRVDLKKAVTNLKGMKTGLEKDVSQSITELKTNFRGFVDLTSAQLGQIGETMTVLSSMGVSNQASAEMFGNLTKTLGHSESKAREIMLNFQATADALGRPPMEMVSDFNKSQPILARFGKRSEQIFKDTATQATFLNMDVKKLISLGESMDTFEGAAKAAQAFNVAIGQPFLSAQALLSAETPAQKLQLIADAYKRAGGAKDNPLSDRMVRALSGDIGVDPGELIRVLKLQKDKYAFRKQKADNATTTLNDAMGLVYRNQSMFDKITAQIERIIDMLIQATGADKGVMFLVDSLASIIKSIADVIDKYGMRGRKKDAVRFESKKQIEKRKALGIKGSKLSGAKSGVQKLLDMAGLGTGAGHTSFAMIDQEAQRLRDVHKAAAEHIAAQQAKNKEFPRIYSKNTYYKFSNKTKSITKLRHKYPIGWTMLAGHAGINLKPSPINKYGNDMMNTANMTEFRKSRMKIPHLGGNEGEFAELFFDVYLPAMQKQGMFYKTGKMPSIAAFDAELVNFKKQFQQTGHGKQGARVVEDGYVQPVFNKNDKFYAAKDGGAIANALDEVLGAVNRLIDEKQDTNLNINERRLAQAVDAAFAYVNGGM